MPTTVEGPVVFKGHVTLRETALPDACVGDDQANPAAPIGATKLEHQHQVVYAQAGGAEAAAEARVVHVVHGASGSIVAFEAGCVEAPTGDATVNVDLLVNGASVLDDPVQITNAEAARELVAGVVASAGLADGDVLEVSVAVDAGTGALGSGVFAQAVLREAAQ